jgi:hypothetical protein
LKPLSINLFPLSFEGEGDTGAEKTIILKKYVGIIILWGARCYEV